MTVHDKLEALAYNAWWTWHPEVRQLFERLNPSVFADTRHNPLAALRNAQPDILEDSAFAADVDTAYDALTEYLEAPPQVEDAPHTAYFCMEYGLHESLPFYSGGLGILAGDHAKAASDLGVPFTAVGLLLKEGYFQQHFTADGEQVAQHTPTLDPADHPLTLVSDANNEPIRIEVPIGEGTVHLQAWKLQLGRTEQYLLDADIPENAPEHRALTQRLYQGSVNIRLRQEIILGIGGLRLLRALNISPFLHHLNEGHCAFATLELMREHLENGKTLQEAEEITRSRCVFTTHTPVMAGHDRFSPEVFEQEMEGFRRQLGVSRHELMAYGRIDPDDKTEPFVMTVLALRLSREANGVSELNGKVARLQWEELRERGTAAPIGHITNGVHLPTWTAPHARAFLNERFGDWQRQGTTPEFWHQVDDLSDAELWQYRSTLRQLLVQFADRHANQQTLPQEPALDPEVLTIGFARRFATYKRATLLFDDVERARRLFTNADRPIQMLYAGKAHPADEGGKAFIRKIYQMSREEGFRGRLVFLENYNMNIGRRLIAGCDVWLNNPRPPMEASGTSGQKVTVHGGLNVSILDGWWPEGYNGRNGWAIGSPSGAEAMDKELRDKSDAQALYHVLEEEVIPCFYDRDEEHLPRQWIARMREAIRTLPAEFSAKRMVRDYVENIYRPVEVQA